MHKIYTGGKGANAVHRVPNHPYEAAPPPVDDRTGLPHDALATGQNCNGLERFRLPWMRCSNFAYLGVHRDNRDAYYRAAAGASGSGVEEGEMREVVGKRLLLDLKMTFL